MQHLKVIPKVTYSTYIWIWYSYITQFYLQIRLPVAMHAIAVLMHAVCNLIK